MPDAPGEGRADHLLVVNAAAGSVVEEAVAAVEAELAEVGEVTVATTADADELDAVLRGRGAQRLVLCGGDGSLHLVLARCRALDIDPGPLGLVPLGTGNDLARNAGLPLDDPTAAAVRIRDGRPWAVDLLVADDGAVCVNAVHAGVGADAAARAEPLKDRLADVAYPVGAVVAGVAASGVHAQVRVDGRPVVDEPVLMIAVCNGPAFGGGATIAPDARLDDGALDVVVATAVGPVARAAFGLALARGGHLERDDVHAASGREVTIRVPDAGDGGLREDVDGELGDTVSARTWRVEPAAWQLLR